MPRDDLIRPLCPIPSTPARRVTSLSSSCLVSRAPPPPGYLRPSTVADARGVVRHCSLPRLRSGPESSKQRSVDTVRPADIVVVTQSAVCRWLVPRPHRSLVDVVPGRTYTFRGRVFRNLVRHSSRESVRQQPDPVRQCSRRRSTALGVPPPRHLASGSGFLSVSRTIARLLPESIVVPDWIWDQLSFW